jgi:hypothetical protein
METNAMYFIESMDGRIYFTLSVTPSGLIKRDKDGHHLINFIDGQDAAARNLGLSVDYFVLDWSPKGTKWISVFLDDPYYGAPSFKIYRKNRDGTVTNAFDFEGRLEPNEAEKAEAKAAKEAQDVANKIAWDKRVAEDNRHYAAIGSAAPAAPASIGNSFIGIGMTTSGMNNTMMSSYAHTFGRE